MQMTIEYRSDKLPIHFDHPVIKTLAYDREGMLTVINQDGGIVNTFTTPASVAFNRQYGTPISPDGKYVFIGVWEKGLFCYSISDGELVKYFLYELPSLKAVGYLGMRELNVRDCLSFVITEARYEGKDLVIRGFENYAGGDYSNNQQVNFERIVHRWQPIAASG